MKSKKRTQSAEVKKGTAPAIEAPSPMQPNWWLLAGGALLLAFIAYAPALRGPFLFDDLAMPTAAPGADQISGWHFLKGTRPLLHFMMWAIRRAAGMNPFPYHVLNVFVHAANALLAFWIVRKFLALAGHSGTAARSIALFCGGVFLLHPVQSEAVAYIASLSETISVLFALAALAVFLRVRERGANWIQAFVVAALTAAGFLFKEHVGALPLVLVLVDIWWRQGSTAQALKRNWRVWAVFGAGGVGAAYMVWRVLSSAKSLGFGVKGVTWWQYILTECRAVWVYLRLYLLPFGQNIDHDYPIAKTFADPFALLGLVAIVICIVAAFRWRSRFALASFGFLALLLMLAPTSSFIPIPDALVERRLYFPFVALLLMTAEALLLWKASTAKQWASFAAILLVCTGLSMRRAGMYADPIAMWEDSVAVNPANSRAQFQLAYAYYEKGRCAEASDRYTKVAAMRAPDYQLLVDWALALDCAGKYEEAARRLQHAVTIENSAHGHALLGMVQTKQGMYSAAEGAFEEAIRIDANYAMAYAYRGNLDAAQGKYQAAADDYRKALTLDPGNPIAEKGASQMEKVLRTGIRPGG